MGEFFQGAGPGFSLCSLPFLRGCSVEGWRLAVGQRSVVCNPYVEKDDQELETDRPRQSGVNQAESLKSANFGQLITVNIEIPPFIRHQYKGPRAPAFGN